ncbi:hypothetical protein DIURU_000552 [Diutina rugosa]|uniref:Mo25-like protein n=1 Tax=Diutina rugosa TaxID=5481 RepID=A0A642UZC0_DIURU|nr:uncharacterized protein DIURU_000552 [Diutina rugosa]KAA8907390.1 hypothetical protein DIURU_000552 [Diutina rugosa]
MAFLFKRNPKTPGELVRAFNDSVAKLDDKKGTGPEECGRYLKQIKVIFYGDDDTEVVPDQAQALGDELQHHDSLYLLATNLRKLEFDSRQDTAMVFAAMMRRGPATTFPKRAEIKVTGDYMVNQRPEILQALINSCDDSDVGLLAGSILRECCKYEPVCGYVMSQPKFWQWFGVVLRYPVFEVANDIFSTIKFCLTTHKPMASAWLVANYDKFVHHINVMITGQNYVFKRSAMRFISTLVQERANQQFLTRYFDDPTNLKVVMMNLNDQSRNLGVDAFNLFKYFVAKPKKNQKVLDILIRNKHQFIALFDRFNPPQSDPNFADEMTYVKREIAHLPDIGEKPPA